MSLLFIDIHFRKIAVPLTALFLISFVVKAGDTIFSNPPNYRLWNADFMQEVFLDDFIGNKLNTDVWLIDYCKSRGYNSNNEGEPKNIEVSDGTLKLSVIYDPGNIDTNCWDNSNFISDYTSAEITTRWDRYKYGCFEAKCLMPRGDHYYYAYWLWGPGDGDYPMDGFASEIDISEGTEWSDGTNHEMKTTVHYWSRTDGEIKLPNDWTYGYETQFEGDWHVYKLIWNPYELIYYVDDAEIWRRSKYYTLKDTKKNDVGMNQIITDSLYQVRDYYPNHHMQNTFQMHIQNGVRPDEIPVSMEVEYVKVKQYFLSPVIECPDVIYTEGTAILDVDSLATNIKWQLSPAHLFAHSSGTGKLANIIALPDAKREASVKYTFQMPSGEEFSASHEFIVEHWTSNNPLAQMRTNDLQNLIIYPNPSGEAFTISVNLFGDMQIEWDLEIYAPNGKLKLKRNKLVGNNFRINISDWENGVYFVRVKSEQGILNGKLIVTDIEK